MKISALDEVDARFEPLEWKWAADHEKEISAHFARVREQRPKMWNGRVLIVRRWKVEGRKLSLGMFETGFASVIAHRAFGFPDESVLHCAVGGALRAADGAYILGVMGNHTANAGRVYFPSAAVDPNDLREGGVVDVSACVVRELDEETGLIPSDYRIEGGWTVIVSGSRLVLLRHVSALLDANTLVERIRRNIAMQREPELTDLVIVRSRADFSPAMPDFVRGYLNAMLPPETA